MVKFSIVTFKFALPCQLYVFSRFLDFDWLNQRMLQKYTKQTPCCVRSRHSELYDDAFKFQIVIDKVTGNQWSGSIAVGITTKTIPLLAAPASALELRDGTWLMTGSCVMKDAVIIKENYGHSLDRLQVQFFLFPFLTLEQVSQTSIKLTQDWPEF